LAGAQWIYRPAAYIFRLSAVSVTTSLLLVGVVVLVLVLASVSTAYRFYCYYVRYGMHGQIGPPLVLIR
jgi:hypothetical protein